MAFLSARSSHAAQISGFAFRGAALLLGFATTYLVARWFGPQGNGYYSLLTQTGMFLSALVAGGLDVAVTREFARNNAPDGRSDGRSAAKVLGYSVAAGLVVLAGYALIMTLVERRADPVLASAYALSIIGLVMLTRSTTRLTGAFLRAKGHYAMGQAVEVIFIPALVLAFALIVRLRSVESMLDLTVICGAVTAVLGLALSVRLVTRDGSAPKVALPALLAVAWPLWGVGVSLNLADWFSTYIVSVMLSISDAGIFRVAVQIGTAVTFGTAGVLAVLSAQMARAKSNEEIGTLIGRSVWLNFALSIGPVVAIYGFAPWILARFGPQYLAGTVSIRILLVGQLLYAFTAPAGQALAIMGHGRTNLQLTGISVLVFLVSAPLLTRMMGIDGTAIAMVLFLVMRNVLAIVMLQRLEGLQVNRLAAQHFPRL